MCAMSIVVKWSRCRVDGIKPSEVPDEIIFQSLMRHSNSRIYGADQNSLTFDPLVPEKWSLDFIDAPRDGTSQGLDSCNFPRYFMQRDESFLRDPLNFFQVAEPLNEWQVCMTNNDLIGNPKNFKFHHWLHISGFFWVSLFSSSLIFVLASEEVENVFLGFIGVLF